MIFARYYINLVIVIAGTIGIVGACALAIGAGVATEIGCRLHAFANNASAGSLCLSTPALRIVVSSPLFLLHCSQHAAMIILGDSRACRCVHPPRALGVRTILPQGLQRCRPTRGGHVSGDEGGARGPRALPEDLARSPLKTSPDSGY